MNQFLILLGKSISLLSNYLNLGSGSTWPGHIALICNSNFIEEILKNSGTRLIIVAGTNGKTTTARMITSIIRENGQTFLQNKAGANLINGLASALIFGSRLNGKLYKDFVIFESDENTLPKILEKTIPDYIVCLNLFRDQLDRYGEIDSIAKRWHSSFKHLTNKTSLILNADDPLISYLSHDSKAKVYYFGLNEKGGKNISHGADSIHCPNCSNKLTYESVSFSHLGIWICSKCGLKRPNLNLSEVPQIALPGTYNKYNSLAAALFAKLEGFDKNSVMNSFKNFTPAFGRQEKLIYQGKIVQLFLSKNPTSLNESLQTIKELGGKNLLIILNDGIPDGLDVSWIWDVNFEDIMPKDINIAVSGDRVYDISLRLKYAGIFTHIEPDLKILTEKMISNLEDNEILYVLPNYSALLGIRKYLLGRKLL